ncbi:DUF2231 domain-containing protein [Microbacterium sp. 10M-3C3]|jgi:uncharacterized membrane protein|uniref:DUF2231 domain-containing protein n=1 Tax=Microbacterium sp. 10M-3C3 TaxID=2483401 RepID=UPI000F63BDE2|nr:DUF2231 domain-containing protein [Microbacterium sp. 10M-3C3]
MSATDGTTGPAMRSAKLPRTALAGPYGHPFHPIAVTIPIGAWTASLVFDVIALIADDSEPWVVGARALILVGLVGAIVAAVLGLLDLSRIPARTPARRTAVTHGVLNGGAIALFAVNAIVRFAAGDDFSAFGFVLSIVTLAVLGVSGWLGGKLSYRWGVRVADESVQREGFAGG